MMRTSTLPAAVACSPDTSDWKVVPGAASTTNHDCPSGTLGESTWVTTQVVPLSPTPDAILKTGCPSSTGFRVRTRPTAVSRAPAPTIHPTALYFTGGLTTRLPPVA